jgi:hypothetical protein
MFNTEWWHSKNQSKELTLGWIYNNHIKNDFAKGYTKNLTDYWSVEMATFLRQQFADDHIGSLFEKAHKAGFSKMLVFKQGTTPLWNFQDEFVKFYDANPDAKFVGHILDQQDNYYTIHPQAFLIDLDWWASVGKPEWGNYEYNVEPYNAIEPIRSEENWHDQYTPHWIKPSNVSKTYTGKQGGWSLVNALMEDGQQIISWNEGIREAKHYTYPEVEYDGPRHMNGILEQLGIDIFFIANTETLPNYKPWFDRRKQHYPEWNGEIRKLMVPAAGLSPLIYAFMLDMPKDSKIFVYDISKFAITITQQIIENWDGTNYREFAEKIMRDAAPDMNRRRDIFRGAAQLKDSEETINKLNDRGFKKWIEEVLPTCEVIYHHMNIMDPHKMKRFANSVKHDDFVSYVHLSNIFHYMPTAFYYSLQQRWQLHNELLDHFKQVSINNNILICSACPSGSRDRLKWVDNWSTDDFASLPDHTVGKLLKWNKTK